MLCWLVGTERQEDDSDFGSSTREGVVVSSDREAADNVIAGKCTQG